MSQETQALFRSLQNATAEPVSWWNLELSEGEIKVASFWQSSLQWGYSFFSGQHKLDLCNRVEQILNTVPSKEVIDQEEQKITMEKVARLMHSPKSWAYHVPVDIENPPQLETHAEETISSLFHPFEKEGRYYNFEGERIWHQFFTTLYLLFPGACCTPSQEDLKTWNRVDWEPCTRSQDLQVTWLGHSTLLLQVKKINILFDPSFGFVSPCFFRHTPPAIPFEKLPLIDVLGISHNHEDHLNQNYVKKLAPFKPFVFAPDRLEDWFKQNGFENVEGKKWWQRTSVGRNGENIIFTAIPAQHGSATHPLDINCSLWMGMMISVDGLHIYFAGDTGYNKAMFDEIKHHFPDIYVAFLPVAPEGEPEMHLDHNEALNAFEALNAVYMIPIHHGAYRMGVEKIEDPLRLLKEAVKIRGLERKVLFLSLGETSLFPPTNEESDVNFIESLNN
jgi:L-ascorbate metabolism protein UlaG (beta-lactamase superfamily)